MSYEAHNRKHDQRYEGGIIHYELNQDEQDTKFMRTRRYQEDKEIRNTAQDFIEELGFIPTM